MKNFLKSLAVATFALYLAGVISSSGALGRPYPIGHAVASLIEEQPAEGTSPEENEAELLAEDLATALYLRPDARDFNARFSAAWKNVCPEANEADLLMPPWCAILWYTPMMAQVEFDDSYSQLFALLAERPRLFQSIRVQVIQARLTLEAAQKDEQAALDEFHQVKENASMSLERMQQRVDEPYEVERTQIAQAEAGVELKKARKKVADAQNALDCVLGKIPCL